MGRMKYDREQATRDREALVRTFPDCFSARGQPKRPLKLGIRADLAAAVVLDDAGEPISEERKQAALKDYCWGPKYQKALLSDLYRIGLDGRVDGKVTTEHKRYANLVLVRIGHAQRGRMAKAAEREQKSA